MSKQMPLTVLMLTLLFLVSVVGIGNAGPGVLTGAPVDDASAPPQAPLSSSRAVTPSGKPSQTATRESQDQQIQRRVRRLLRDDPRTRPFAAEANVQAGRVVLSGHTYYAADRELAQRTAAAVAGVLAVQNLIVIDPNPDLEIARKLHEAFSRDPLVDDAGIGITVIKGRVYLSGTANSTNEVERVDLLTRSIPGVVAISNKLEVSPAGKTVPPRAALPGRTYRYPTYGATRR